MKVKKKLPLQKAANGLHEVVTTPPGPGAGRGLLRGALQAGGDAAIPGLGTAVGLVDDASGLLKDKDGLYSNRFNQALDGLNPVEQFSRMGKGWGKVFQGDVKGALGAFAGDQTDLKDQLGKQAYQKGYVAANDRVGGMDPTTTQRSTYKEGTSGIGGGKRLTPTPTRQDSVTMATQGFPLKSYYGPKKEVADAEGKQALAHYQANPTPWTHGITPTGYQVTPNAGGGYDMGLTFPYPQGMKAPTPAPVVPTPVAAPAPTPRSTAYQSQGGYYDKAPGKGFGKFGEGTEGAQATKPIEVEKDELIFRKVGDKFRLKADFKGGKSHKQGGEDYQAQEGDIIFPGKQRGKVLSHYKEGNHSALEGMRMRLPLDTNPEGKAARGWNGDNDPDNLLPTQPLPSRYAPGAYTTNPANRYGAYGAYPQARAGLATGQSEYLAQNPLASRPEDYRGPVLAYQDPRNRPGQKSYYQQGLPQELAPRNPLEQDLSGGIPQQVSSGVADNFQSLPAQTASPQGEAGAGAGMGNLLKYASVANNLIQGYSKPEKVQENYLDPQLNQYADRSEPQRRQSNMVATQQAANARNTSGGNVSNLRANQQMAAAGNYDRRQEIDNREQGLADNIRAGNVGLINQAKQVNSQKLDQYGALNAQARANQQAYKDAAYGQLQTLGEANEKEGYQRSRDSKLDARDETYLKYLNAGSNYSTNGLDGQFNFTPIGSAGAANTTTSTREATDVYGRKTSATTTSIKKDRNLLGLKRRK